MTDSNTPTPTPGGTGPSSAVDAFEAFLAREDGPDPLVDTQTPRKAKAAPKDAEADDAEALAAEAELDETPPDEEGDEPSEDEGADEVEASADDEDEPDEQPDEGPELVTVTIDGKEEQLPLEEVVKGYQRQADFTRKTQALAEERKRLDSELDEVSSERQQYAQLLSALEETLQQMQPQEPDWERLYQEDPLEYVRMRDVWNDRAQKLQKIQAEQAHLQQQEAQVRAKTLQQQIETARDELLKAIPEWQDKQKWDADRTALREYGRTMGYSDEELNSAYDHRAIVILNKAMKYDRMMAKRPKPATHKGPKVASGGSSNSTPRRTTAQTKAKQRLAKTGSIHDAAKVFETLI